MKRLKLKNGLIVLALLPLFVMFVLIVHYSVNVPVTDQYAFIPIFQSLDHGHIPFAAFWAQHNEHRVLFPNIILVSMARITHWNILAEIFLSFIIACIGFLAIIMLIRRRIQGYFTRLFAIFLASCFFFSPAQWENWIWGWQLEWFLCVACILWAINLQDRLRQQDKKRSLVGSIVFAVVATFSLGSGSLSWLAGLIVMLTRRLRFAQIKIWLASAAVSLFLYYYHYHKPQDGLSSTSFLSNIPQFIRHYFAYVGRPISDDTRLSVFAGIYILIILAIVLAITTYRHKITENIAVISMAVVGLVTGLLTGVARFDYGIAGALSSRYTAFSELILTALIILVVNLLKDIKLSAKNKYAQPAVYAVVMVLVLPALVYSWMNGLSGLRARSTSYKYIYSCSRQAHPDQACLYQIYFPSTQIAQNDLNYLKNRHYGGY